MDPSTPGSHGSINLDPMCSGLLPVQKWTLTGGEEDVRDLAIGYVR